MHVVPWMCSPFCAQAMQHSFSYPFFFHIAIKSLSAIFHLMQKLYTSFEISPFLYVSQMYRLHMIHKRYNNDIWWWIWKIGQIASVLLFPSAGWLSAIHYLHWFNSHLLASWRGDHSASARWLPIPIPLNSYNALLLLAFSSFPKVALWRCVWSCMKN